MKVYIAGKITDDPDYFIKFMDAAYPIRTNGHTVLNPAFLPPGFTHSEYLHICLAMIDVVEVVYFLSDWQESKGAKIEYAYAREKGKHIEWQDYRTSPGYGVTQ